MIKTIALVSAGLLCRGVHAQTLISPASYTRTEVTEHGLNGHFYEPKTHKGPLPTMIVIGGSEGGDTYSDYWGPALAKEGFGVLTLAYFNKGALPKNLVRIPMEYFKTAIDWLKKNPAVDPNRIGMAGLSRGAEGALVAGSLFRDLHLIVAGAPTHYRWQGFINNFTFVVPAAWTYQGMDMPHATIPKNFKTAEEIYTIPMKDPATQKIAAIPVENINGPVVLFAGGQDQVWPSATMAHIVIDRLKAKHFKFDAVLHEYKNAGHVFLGPQAPGFNPAKYDNSRLAPFGGTKYGNLFAIMDAWPHMVKFLKSHL